MTAKVCPKCADELARHLYDAQVEGDPGNLPPSFGDLERSIRDLLCEDAARAIAFLGHCRCDSERLTEAIRAFTRDPKGPDGQPIPNGPAEAKWAEACDILLLMRLPVEVREKLAEFCSLDADRLQALREAAESYFGEGFR